MAFIKMELVSPFRKQKKPNKIETKKNDLINTCTKSSRLYLLTHFV